VSKVLIADTVRRGQRLIRMVSELHRLGYQRLRIMPYEAEMGYRLLIGPADGFSSTNGAYCARPIVLGARDHVVEGPASWPPFEWADAAADTARRLADKFIVRFPELSAAGRGRDWLYAGWLSELLGVLETDRALPVTMLEFMSPKPWEMTSLILRPYGSGAGDGQFALPPPGHRPAAQSQAVDTQTKR